MFCGHCGFKVENNMTVCPNCGGRLNPVNSAVPQNNPNGGSRQTPAYNPQQNNAYGSPYPGRPGETGQSGGGKKKAKFPVKAVIACLLAAALIVSGIIFLPRFLPLGGSKAGAFEAKAKKMDKDDDNYLLLSAVAAAENLLFNAKSFTFSGEIYGNEASASGRVVWGKDLLSPKIVFSGDTDWDEKAEFAMKDGKAVVAVSEGYDWEFGVSVDLNNLYKDRATLKKQLGDYILQNKAINEETKVASNLYNKVSKEDKFDDNWFSLLGSRGINRNAFNYMIPVLSSLFTIEYAEINPEGLDYDDISALAADFLAELPYGVFETRSTGKSAGSFDYTLNGYNFAKALYNYIKGSDVIRSAMTGELYREVCDELTDEMDYIDFSAYGHVEIEDGYITSISANVDGEELFSARFRDINKTKIEQSDYDNVESKYKSCEEKYSYDDIGDLKYTDDGYGDLAVNYISAFVCPREGALAYYMRDEIDWLSYLFTDKAETVYESLKDALASNNLATYGTATVRISCPGGHGPIKVEQTGLTIPAGSELLSWDDFITNTCYIHSDLNCMSDRVCTITVTYTNGGYSTSMNYN